VNLPEKENVPKGKSKSKEYSVVFFGQGEDAAAVVGLHDLYSLRYFDAVLSSPGPVAVLLAPPAHGPGQELGRKPRHLPVGDIQV
jgi:hypothetical protein